MRPEDLQDSLGDFSKPSQYLGSEVNCIRKDPNSVDGHVALVFPDLYEIGTSHFGMQILYHILNERHDIAAERFFSPDVDYEKALRDSETPPGSLESGRSLGEFGIVGFSLLYELNYTNVLTLLDLAGIPLRSADRGSSHPLIIAGGPCTFNPEPMAPFFDAMVIGDGEVAIGLMVDEWLKWQSSPGGSREGLLEDWSKIEGVYIPAFFEVQTGSDGHLQLRATENHSSAIRRTVIPDLEVSPFPNTPVVPFGRPVHDRLRLELARGCTRGCRFCQAGMIYRPVRERSVTQLLDQAQAGLDSTGYEDISLLSLSTGDYSRISELMGRMMNHCAADRVAMSLPSLRAGTLSPEMMDMIKQVRKTGFTLAPEAGSERLRRVINKGISESDILQTVADSVSAGWRVIKLYFMIGLPTETQDDLAAIVALVKRIQDHLGPKRRQLKINISISTFIPKPHTPFQWMGQLSSGESLARRRWLKEALNMPGVTVKGQHSEMSRLEGVLSRGDRRMAAVIQTAYENGCRFDGWTDRLKVDQWEAALSAHGVDPESVNSRERSLTEPLPWDHIDSRIDKSYLVEEWHRAGRGEGTADCRFGECTGCGVCDFQDVHPRLAPEESPAPPAATPDSIVQGSDAFRPIVLTFSKTGSARWLGHLETIQVFSRAFRRAGVPLRYTGGFHPKAKMTFGDALPVGMASLGETCRIEVLRSWSPEDIMDRVNATLVGGFRIEIADMAGNKSKTAACQPVAYRIRFPEGGLDTDRLSVFLAAETWPVDRTNKKGKRIRLDLRPFVETIDIVSDNQLEIRLVPIAGRGIRPRDILSGPLNMETDTLKQCDILKIGSV